MTPWYVLSTLLCLKMYLITLKVFKICKIIFCADHQSQWRGEKYTLPSHTGSHILLGLKNDLSPGPHPACMQLKALHLCMYMYLHACMDIVHTGICWFTLCCCILVPIILQGEHLLHDLDFGVCHLHQLEWLVHYSVAYFVLR
jgi:hypothetical protein